MSEVADLYVELRGHAGQLISELGRAGAAAQTTEAKMAAVRSGVMMLGKGTLIAAGLIAVASVKVASDWEDAHVALERTFKNAGTSIEDYKGQIATVSATMEHFGYSHTQTETALNSLVIATQKPEQSIKLLGIAADVAAAKHIDLQSASMLVAKAQAGQLRGLKALGIDLPISAGGAAKVAKANEGLAKAQQGVSDVMAKYHNAQKVGAKGHEQYEKAARKVAEAQKKVADVSGTADKIVQALADRTKGQASTAADTFSGNLKEMKAAVTNLMIAIGNKLIPVIMSVIKFFKEHSTVGKVLAGVVGTVLVGALVAYLGKLAIAAVQSTIEFGKMLITFGGWVSTQAAGLASTAALYVTYYATLAVEAVISAATQVAAAVGVAAAWVAANIAMIVASGGILLAIGLLIAGALWLWKHWHQVWDKIKAIIKVGVDWVKRHMGLVVLAIIGPVGFLVYWVVTHWSQIWAAVKSAVSSAKTFIGDKISGIVGFFKALPGRVTGALGNLKDALVQKGKDTIQGFLNGAGSLLSTIGSFFLSKLPGWIVGPFKKALGIHSPSKVFHALGLTLTQGLANGVAAGTKAAVDKVREMADGVLARARERLATLRQDRAQFATSVRDNLLGGVDVTQSPMAGQVLTAGDITGNLTAKLAQYKRFAADLAKLKKAGLRGDIMEQIINAGPEGGMAAAEALMGDQASINQANATQAQIVKVATKTGQQTGDDMYAQRIAQAIKTVNKDTKLVADVHVYLDGKKVHHSTQTHSQRHTRRNGNTGNETVTRSGGSNKMLP